ncbi:MAG: DUF5011 domain-containing protein [Candidatus Hydrogenedentes bacterium]|nr:DUF5011 domain-containing protein [Candidatus Hydrogenedentota bacterium]
MKYTVKFMVVITLVFLWCVISSLASADSSDFLSNPLDTGFPVITRTGAALVTIQKDTSYTDAGAVAIDTCDGDLSTGVVVGGDTVDTSSPGIYVITYNVSDGASNAAAEVTRTVNVVTGIALTVAPVADISIGEGANTTLTAVASEGTTVYTYQWQVWNDSIPGWELVLDGVFDAGVYAGAMTSTLSFEPFTALMEDLYRVEVHDGVDTVYAEVMVTHAAGSCSFLSAPLDTGPPVILLTAGSFVTVEYGDSYVDAGAVATDTCDGDLSTGIVVGGDTVDASSPGIYVITYNVSDGASNAAAEVTRTVNVVTAVALTVAPVADILIGEGVNTTLIAVASEGTTVYTYQWYVWNDGIPGWELVLDGAFDAGIYAGTATSTLSFEPFTALMEGLYRVEVYDGVDTVYAEVTVTHMEVPTVPAANISGLVVLLLAIVFGGVLVLRCKTQA